MSKRSFFAAALCAAVFAGGSVSAALAGEVKGPPNQQNNTNDNGCPGPRALGLRRQRAE